MLAALRHFYDHFSEAGNSGCCIIDKGRCLSFGSEPYSAWGYHFFQTAENTELTEFVTYVDGWLAPTAPQIAETLGRDMQQLEAGLSFFRGLPSQPDSAVTVTIFRAIGYKSGLAHP